MARIRFLVGHGFKLMLGGEEPTAAAWKKITAQAEQKGEQIAEELLSRRQQSR